MVIQTGILKFQPLEWMKSNSVVFMCGALTFLYIVELSLGIRIVCFACEHWKQSKISEPQSSNESWNIGIASILIAVLSAGLVNMLSVYWEHRINDTDERLSRVRITSHVLHALIGGILWRYIALWRAEDVKKEAILLTSAKFLFTQFYTIPLLIIHVSISTDLNGTMFDVALIISATATVLMACIIFKDGPEMQDQNSFCETMILVPLIFRQPPQAQTDEQKENEEGNRATHPNRDKKIWAICLLRIVVSVQIFFFSYGRLLALGFLLKMAGIYAVTVLFLQVLISALYLKFQAPYIFAETQKKHKQLMRIAFLSYALVFELHLHREKDTGYNLGTKIRQGVLYYFTTTTESVFYITMWAVTEGDKLNNQHFPYDTKKCYQTKTVVLLVGYLSLLISAVIHIFLALLRSYQKVEVFSRIKHIRDVTFDAVRRRMSRVSVQQPSPPAVNPASFVDIASFTKSPTRCEITLPKLQAADPSKFCNNGLSNSYCDFKDRIDDHVNIEPKENRFSSEASKKRRNSNASRKENVDSSPNNTFSVEAKTVSGQQNASSGRLNERAVGCEVRSPPSPKFAPITNESSEKSHTTPKHFGAITRLWEKYSKFSSKRFSKLGSRFRNFTQNTNEIQKTSSSGSAGKENDHYSERKAKIAAEAPSREETAQKSPKKHKQNHDTTRSRQTCKKMKTVPRISSLSPETAGTNKKRGSPQKLSEAPGRRNGKSPSPNRLSPKMKRTTDQVKPHRDLNGRSNTRSEDEEDVVFVKGTVPKILITPDKTESSDTVTYATQIQDYDYAEEVKDMKPKGSNHKQRRGSQHKEN